MYRKPVCGVCLALRPAAASKGLGAVVWRKCVCTIWPGDNGTVVDSSPGLGVEVGLPRRKGVMY